MTNPNCGGLSVRLSVEADNRQTPAESKKGLNPLPFSPTSTPRKRGFSS